MPPWYITGTVSSESVRRRMKGVRYGESGQYCLYTVEPLAGAGAAQGEHGIASQRVAHESQSSQIDACREARIDTDGAAAVTAPQK